MRPLRAICLVSLLFLPLACETYVPPPKPQIDGLQQGILQDATLPIVVDFGVPIDPTTLNLKIARYVVDANGNLPDEQTPPQDLSILFSTDPDNGDVLGTSVLSADKTSLTITPSATMPTGPQLVLIVEPGLVDPVNGRSLTFRKKILFSYAFHLDCNAPTTVASSGTFFFLVDVKDPIGTQVKLWADLNIDSATGQFSASFSKAYRNVDASRCAPLGLTCDATQACRTLPAPACVAPSEVAGSPSEYPDFIAQPDPPGFSFTAKGCIVDQGDGSATFGIVPVDIIVSSPNVTLRASTLTASFRKDSNGVVQATGALTAEQVLLGAIDSGKGDGTLSGQQVPASAAPTNIPAPP
ncbi:MAG: hypothetical protein ACHREM_09270 [Polyangiales bacterium]